MSKEHKDSGSSHNEDVSTNGLCDMLPDGEFLEQEEEYMACTSQV